MVRNTTELFGYISWCMRPSCALLGVGSKRGWGMETLLHVTDFAENISGSTWLEFQLVHSCSHVLQRFRDYLDFLRTENGDLSTFWMSYVDMVEMSSALSVHPGKEILSTTLCASEL